MTSPRSADDDGRPFQPALQPGATGYETLSLQDLTLLREAYARASAAYCSITNQPRCGMTADAWITCEIEHTDERVDAIEAEIERRRPNNEYDQCLRLGVLFERACSDSMFEVRRVIAAVLPALIEERVAR